MLVLAEPINNSSVCKLFKQQNNQYFCFFLYHLWWVLKNTYDNLQAKLIHINS